jgi:hypothetical protein
MIKSNQIITFSENIAYIKEKFINSNQALSIEQTFQSI